MKCAPWRSWPAGRPGRCRRSRFRHRAARLSRSVRRRARQRASADAAPVRSPWLGRTATYGRWRATLFAARHLPPRAGAATQPGGGHQPGGITRILELEEENRELRRQVERLRKPAGSSVFAADADGGIVEVERSQRARMWRRQLRADARQLPSRESVRAERAEEGDDMGSRSVVVWGIR